MSSGELRPYLIEKYDGDVIISTALTQVSVGGFRNPRYQRIMLDTSLSRVKKIDKALLELAITSPFNPLNSKWKLVFDGFTLTREFKPQLSVEENGVYHSKLLFDITPVIKPYNRHAVGVQFDGAQPLTIDHVNLLVFYPTSEVKTSVAYFSGMLLLKPGETVEIPINIEPIEGEDFLKVIGIVPSKQAKIEFYLNGKMLNRFEGVIGVEEISYNNNIGVSSENKLRIAHLPAETKYYPNMFRLSTIIIGKAKYSMPDMDIGNVRILEDSIEVEIRNNNNIKPDRVVLLAISLGNIIFRKKIEDFPENGVQVVRIPLNKNKAKISPITLRIVWNKLSRSRFKEKRIEL